jgi:glutaredoxin
MHGSAQLKSMLDKASAFSYRTHLLDLHRQQADQNIEQQKNESSAMPVVINLNSDKAIASERKD